MLDSQHGNHLHNSGDGIYILQPLVGLSGRNGKRRTRLEVMSIVPTSRQATTLQLEEREAVCGELRQYSYP